MAETQIIKGVVLSSCDYKEKDKLVEIFSLELGKITAVIKSCKAPNAKLKFAFQSFCFAEFSVIKNGKFYQVIDAKQIDSFFDLTLDLSTFYLSSLVLELTSISIDLEEQNPQLFLLLLNTLKHICYDNMPVHLVTAKFCQDILTMLGYKVDYSKCVSFGTQYLGKIFLNLDTGAFVCNNCKTETSLQISVQAFSLLKIINQTSYDRLGTIKIADYVAREAILVVCKNIEYRLLKVIRSAKFI